MRSSTLDDRGAGGVNASLVVEALSVSATLTLERPGADAPLAPHP
jgi:hypothetical protein